MLFLSKRTTGSGGWYVAPMLFPKELWPQLSDGSVTAAYRRWKRPTVKAGGTLVVPVGVLGIDSIDTVDPSTVTDADACRAGFDTVADLLRSVDRNPDRPLVRIRFHFAGDDPRISLRNDDDLDADAIAAITQRLDRYDRSSRRGPWTRATLDAIAAEPGRRAPDLAERFNCETKLFKTDVRKLKALGLTESLRIGYQLSPRGKAYLDYLPE